MFQTLQDSTRTYLWATNIGEKMERVIRERHVVTAEFEGVRFQEYCVAVLELIPSRAGVKKAIKRGDLFIDGNPAETGRYMIPGMIVELLEGILPSSRRFEIELPVLFEDPFLAVINKPAGIPVSGNYFKTIQNGLAGNIGFSSESDALAVPRPVQRLDSLTSGILIIAKTTRSLIALGNMLESRKIQKIYHAVCIGDTPEFGEMNVPVENKESHSSFRKIRCSDSIHSGKLSLLELKPHTGRTHQLRIHCAHEGFPIAGDLLYGDRKNTPLHKGLFLTATGISFLHPITGEQVTIEIPVPHKFERYLENEQKMFERYQQGHSEHE